MTVNGGTPIESVINSVTSTSVYNGDGLRMSHTFDCLTGILDESFFKCIYNRNSLEKEADEAERR
jgi:hypothetical protein